MNQNGRDESATEAQFRLFVQAVADHSIHMLDTAGVITSWNAGCERAFGAAEGEMLGRDFARCFPPEDAAPAFLLATARSAGTAEAEAWRLRKDSTRFWARTRLDAVRDTAGAITGFAAITRDITQSHDLAQAREQLYHAQKMELMGQLTGGVAHDFNNLLAAVTGSLELIVASLGDELLVRRLVTTAQRAAERGSKLTSQLLTFARREKLKPEASSVNELVVAVEDLLRRALGETVALELQLAPDLPQIDIDRPQFQSALLNLVVNAQQAMPRGGTLSICTTTIDIDSRQAAEADGLAPGRHVLVTVTDDGEGMSQDVRLRAAEPFYTTKGVGGGSGLGLSQVYAFMQQSGGQMKIASETGAGTCVSLILPLSAGAAPTQVAAPLKSEAPPPASILVVEDDPDVLTTAIAVLESFGYQVHFAQDAYEALTIMQRNVPIDLLFTDIVMPRGMSGTELAREARRLKPRLPVLLASGYPRESLQEREDLAENTDFIGKPYSLTSLSEKLAELLPPRDPTPRGTIH